MKDVALFSKFPTSKKEQGAVATGIVNRCLDGDVDPLRVKVQLSALEGVIKKIKETPEFNDLILKKSEERNAKTFDEYGAMFQIKEVGVKYDFSVCEDPVYTSLALDKIYLDEQMKEREAFLKSIPPKGQTIVNDETGEVCTVYPPAKSSTTSVTVTIK